MATADMASRPQVGIDRLPIKKATHGERESMNCKSCRRRKIKCNRLRPTCESCSIFQCPCIYDAVPKKRGPKTDANMLEALLKRFDGLEKKLQNEKSLPSSTSPTTPPMEAPPLSVTIPEDAKRPAANRRTSYTTQPQIEASVPQQLPEEIVETYLAKIHGKPYYILDETTFRQMNQSNQLPTCLVFAVYAVTMRYARGISTQQAAKSIAEKYASQARALVDIDEPSIESLQTLLLLSLAFYAVGKGKKAYTTLYNSVSMAYAMELHREAPLQLKLLSSERELRRRLFWSCYIMDRFNNCGSKRPSIISDTTIRLKLPSYTPHAAALSMEGKPFNDGPNLQFTHDPSRQEQGAITLLIDVVRILGMTNHYLAGGGVAGDHHFPWHTSSTLSKIRSELNIWAASTQNCFASVESLFGHPDSTTLFLSKLVYHLIHILTYRNFLPVNLNELRGTGQHQSWQIEATNQCFLHANLTAELVELGRRDVCMEWPAFVGYCICTAASVHVHGHHYQGQAGEVFAMSSHYLQKEYEQLTMLSSIWAGVAHQKRTLETITACHAQLVKSQESQVQFSPVYLEDFFDRYPGYNFEGSHVSFKDIIEEDYTVSSMWSSHQVSIQETVPNQAVRPAMGQRRPSQMTTSQQHPVETMFGSGQQHFTALTPAQTPIRPVTNMSSQHSQSKHHAPDPAAFGSPFTFPTSLPFPTPLKGATHEVPDAASPFVIPYSPVTLEDMATYANANALTGGTYPSGSNRLVRYHPEDPLDHDMTAIDTNSQSGSGAQLTPASDGDPFLKLLEELAQNEQSQGGPSELDYFLNPAVAPDAGNRPSD